MPDPFDSPDDVFIDVSPDVCVYVGSLGEQRYSSLWHLARLNSLNPTLTEDVVAKIVVLCQNVGLTVLEKHLGAAWNIRTN